MATSNERIRDALVGHQVRLLGHAKWLAREIVRILNRGEPELRALVKDRLAAIRLKGGHRVGPMAEKQLAALADAIQDTSSPTFEKIRELVEDDLGGVLTSEVAFVSTLVAAETPVAVQLARPAEDILAEILERQPIAGAALAEWLDRFERNDRTRILEEVKVGLTFSETPLQVSRRVFGTAKLGGMDGARAKTRRGALAMTNTLMSGIVANAREALYLQNADIIPDEIFVATLDARTTPICRSLDGKRFPVGEGPRPPLHINCRSLRVPFVSAEALATRPAVPITRGGRELEGLKGAAKRAKVASLVGRVPGKTTYTEWLRGQPASFQDSILGPTRGKLFRAGKLHLDRFVDPAGNLYTLRELYEVERAAFRRAGLDASDLPRP